MASQKTKAGAGVCLSFYFFNSELLFQHVAKSNGFFLRHPSKFDKTPVRSWHPVWKRWLLLKVPADGAGTLSPSLTVGTAGTGLQADLG
jgi:hypothetical protein